MCRPRDCAPPALGASGGWIGLRCGARDSCHLTLNGLRRRSLDGDVVLDATDDRPEVSHSVATAAVDAGAIINDRLEEVANFVGKGQRPLVPIGWHKLVNDLHLLVAFFMLLLAHVPTSTLTARRLRGDRSPCAPCQHQFR